MATNSAQDDFKSFNSHDSSFLRMINRDVITHNRDILTDGEVNIARRLLNGLEKSVQSIGERIEHLQRTHNPKDVPLGGLGDATTFAQQQSEPQGVAVTSLFTEFENETSVASPQGLAICSLVAERDIAAAQIARLRCAISPHRRLPPEVLTKIFIDTFDGVINFRVPVESTGIPWVLRSVCSAWRAAAIREPALWSNLVITLGAQPNLSYINEVINPHGPLSLSVFVDGLLMPQDHGNPAEMLIQMKIPWHRLTKVNIGEMPWPLETASQVLQLCPSIQSFAFCLEIYGWFNPMAPPRLAIPLPSVPLLTSVRILFYEPTLPLPWLQLTELTLVQPFDLTCLLDGLKQCLHLKSFCLLEEGVLGSIKPIARVRLPSLESLFLSTGASWILLMLEVPTLRALRLSAPSPHIDNGSLFSSIHDMITRSLCELHSLHVSHQTSLANNPPAIELFSHLVDALPELTQLLTPGITLPEKIVDGLAHGTTLPHLQHLEVHAPVLVEFTRMISQRASREGSGLRVACGHYPAQLDTPASVTEANKVLCHLNRKLGTDFSIVYDHTQFTQSPDDAEWIMAFRLGI
ncbi:hypothetical protein DXG01_015136 [Tephrocybe rancida]|nr:hypothetical protein DXG01_015136 [Tephrocybe rancida]